VKTGWSDFIQFVEGRGTLPHRNIIDLAEISVDNPWDGYERGKKGIVAALKHPCINQGALPDSFRSIQEACFKIGSYYIFLLTLEYLSECDVNIILHDFGIILIETGHNLQWYTSRKKETGKVVNKFGKVSLKIKENESPELRKFMNGNCDRNTILSARNGT